MNPITERQLRINESRFDLTEEKWLANTSQRTYSPANFGGKKVVKGPPKATENHSTKELIDQGLVGVYER